MHRERDLDDRGDELENDQDDDRRLEPDHVGSPMCGLDDFDVATFLLTILSIVYCFC